MKQTIFRDLTKSMLFVVLIVCLMTSCSKKEVSYYRLQGNVFGTTFQIQYADASENNYNQAITLLFDQMNNSLSTYHPNSLISQLNKDSSELMVDDNFIAVFKLSKKVYESTDGYFDPTVGKMVNAWGFGYQESSKILTNQEVDSLMQYVGFDKVVLDERTVVKKNPDVVFDFNAVAKGYGVDLVALFLEQKGVKDYLVEIGGEIRAKGKNKRNQFWSVGIEEPNFDGSRSLQKVVRLEHESIATSGNYRKYRIDSVTGEKIAHTFNPKRGIPAKTDLLSVSIISSLSCGEIDAYATAFMAMGYKKARKLADNHKEMKVYFIYLDQDEIKTDATPNLKFVETL